MNRCRVSSLDSDQTEHAVEIEAESLYETVAQAVAEFREDPLIEAVPVPMTEWTVAVLRPPAEHKIRLQRVIDWSQSSTKGGPSGINQAEKVPDLMGERH